MSTLDQSKNLRKLIYDSFLMKRRSPTIDEICIELNLSKSEAVVLLEGLYESHLIALLPDTYQVLIANPFCNIAHSIVKTSTSEFPATCAWDAIAMGITLGEKIWITSYCNFCGKQISLEMVEAKLLNKSPETLFVHFGKPVRDWWNNIVDTCMNQMNFYCSNEHLDLYLMTNPQNKGYALSEAQVIGISKLFYTNKLSLDYVRPSQSEIETTFTDLGLTGEFWTLT